MPLGAARAAIISSPEEAVPEFPQVADADTQAFASSATSFNVAMPTTVNSGDLLIIIFTIENTSSTVMTTPSGWTAKQAQTSFNEVDGAVFMKDADGTEGGTNVTISMNTTTVSATAHVYRISANSWGGDLANDVEVGTAVSASTASPNPPSLTPSWGSAKNLWIEFCHAADDDATFTAASTNYGNLLTVASGADDGTGIGCETGSARRELEATSDDPDAMTLSESESTISNLIAIEPAA